MMRKHNKIISMLFMFFFLLFDCLIRAGGSGWVGWAFAHPIFLDEKDRLILFCLLALLLMQQLPTQTVGASTDPVNDIDGEGWKRLFYDLTVDNLMYYRIWSVLLLLLTFSTEKRLPCVSSIKDPLIFTSVFRYCRIFEQWRLSSSWPF